MPYNPSSAYPRHSTYTPPVYGRSYAKGFNEVDWTLRNVGVGAVPRADVHGALQRAMTRPSSEARDLTLQAMGRKGLVSQGFAALDARTAEKRADYRNTRKQAQRQAAEGAMTGAEPAAAESYDPQDFYEANKMMLNWKSPYPSSPVGPAGGREHSGIVSDQLGAMSQREEMTTGIENAANDVLTGNIGGRMKIPKLVRGGWSRLRGGA